MGATTFSAVPAVPAVPAVTTAAGRPGQAGGSAERVMGSRCPPRMG
ncbi:MAG: hypothetical protein AVDCRST_MAG49-4608 [uncultured Thermomicrobiales bacterium]|uniref:Uncharacterized protein n=1 Tax=uncultured Thermomicrobiales bacterium TaxID=1645740 RepID=A0A6J4VJQ4_9BACT|nr:MAG: hypothetical protein AVDCRST_MAG49-4608 [uncultured Thermomicrobiales bacterium]